MLVSANQRWSVRVEHNQYYRLRQCFQFVVMFLTLAAIYQFVVMFSACKAESEPADHQATTSYVPTHWISGSRASGQLGK